MRCKEKFLAVFLAFAMFIVSFGSLNPVFAGNDAETPVITEPVITVDNITATKGASVDVNVKVAGNPGIMGGTLKISYDDKLILSSVKNGDAFAKLTMTKPGQLISPCKVVWDGQELAQEDIKDGVILTLSFKISDDVEDDSELGVNIEADGGFTDKDLNSVSIKTISGKIKISGDMAGDVNDDKVVNPTDVILIRRHLAGGYGVKINERAANVDAKDGINTVDIILIRRYLATII